VGFRFFVERVAHQLELSGYVKNLRDGRVEVYALGPAERMAELKRRLVEGPRGAHVSRVEEEETTPLDRYRNSFSVEFEGGLW
jgi:acylphosphatase